MTNQANQETGRKPLGKSELGGDRESEIKEDFMTRLIATELERLPFSRSINTRFPPEPNGYLHIGSAYAIHTNYQTAQRFGGAFHLRFDDTNPLKEDISYVHAILEDIKWLGYDPGSHVYYGSDYSDQIHDAAVSLIKKGLAYVCDLSPDEMTAYRGTLTEPGRNSPFRDRTVDENLMLFARMKKGDFPAASRVLRAKIDMASPNINLRDPVLYRIIHAEHYRTGKDWCIYPMYDFAHPIQDAIEGIAYSLCSIEFKGHRPLYEWVLEGLDTPEPPRQREFGRLNLTGVVTSKRFLRSLVEGGHVEGWDDPRLPTLRGMRRRGYTPESITAFIEAIGSIRTESTVDISLLDHCLRQDLKGKAASVMAVLNPLKVVIENYPEHQTEWLSVENNSENENLGKREIPFSRTLYIERDDYMEVPSKGFRRLVPGGEVRLKGAYFIKCVHAVTDPETGEIAELRCTYDPLTKSGTGFEGRKVKGTIHWVSAEHAVKANVSLYEKLLRDGETSKEDGRGWEEKLNPASKVVIRDALLEPFIIKSLAEQEDTAFQFMRHGFFCRDREVEGKGSENSEGSDNGMVGDYGKKCDTGDRIVFNRIVPLKDSWGKK